MFVAGKPIFENRTKVEEIVAPEQDVLNEAELQQYLEGLGEWKLGNSDLVEDQTSESDIKHSSFSVTTSIRDLSPNANHNPHLSKIVEDIQLVLNPPPPPAEPKVPDFPIRACIIGKAFSGKTTQSNYLISKYKVNRNKSIIPF